MRWLTKEEQAIGRQAYRLFLYFTKDTNAYFSNKLTDKKAKEVKKNAEEARQTARNLSGDIQMRVGQAIESVAATMNESSMGVQEITKGTEHVSHMMLEVNESSTKLADMTDELKDIIDQYRISRLFIHFYFC